MASKTSPWDIMRKVVVHFIPQPQDVSRAESVDELIDILSDTATQGLSETSLWLTQTEKVLKTEHDPLQCDLTSQIGQGHHKTDLQLLTLIRECMLSHRWVCALQVLCEIVNEPVDIIATVWRVGFEIIKHFPEDTESNGLLDNFTNQLRRSGSKYPTEKHIVLEQCLYLLSSHNVSEALNLINQHKLSLRMNTSKAEAMCSNLLMGYSAMCNFYLWKKAMQSLKMSAMEEGISNYQTELMLESNAKSHSFEACKGFKQLLEIQGNWDIFVVCYLEIIESIEGEEFSLKIVKDYCELNPSDLSSTRLLYQYMSKRTRDKSELMNVLEKIVKNIPSDGLCLELCDLYSEVFDENECLTKRLPILFDYLDYPQHEHSEQPWKMLSTDILKFCAGTNCDKTVLYDCLVPRLHWWPALYFYIENGTIMEFNNLLVYKAIVAKLFLLGTGDFFQFIRSNPNLSEDGKKKIDEVKPILS